MRVIAGKHKSKSLETLEGRNTRPTMDKVKKVFLIVYIQLKGWGLICLLEVAV